MVRMRGSKHHPACGVSLSAPSVRIGKYADKRKAFYSSLERVHVWLLISARNFIAYDGRPGELTYVAIIFPEDRLVSFIRLVFSIAFVSISV